MKDNTLHAVFLMHEAWNYGQVFIATTVEQANAKMQAHLKEMLLPEKPADFAGTDEEYIESVFEDGRWTLEDAEVHS